MNILLDTHVLIWALTESPRLSKQETEMILSPENHVCYSAVSLWEIELKNQKSPEKCPYHEAQVQAFCELAGYSCLNILPSHILSVRHLRIRDGHTLSNPDPFDRMLIAQAKTEGLLLLSHDGNFEHYEEDCIHLTR